MEAERAAEPSAASMGIPSIVDGSKRIGHVDTRITEAICAYPLTPSTEGMASG